MKIKLNKKWRKFEIYFKNKKEEREITERIINFLKENLGDEK